MTRETCSFTLQPLNIVPPYKYIYFLKTCRGTCKFLNFSSKIMIVYGDLYEPKSRKLALDLKQIDISNIIIAWTRGIILFSKKEIL